MRLQRPGQEYYHLSSSNFTTVTFHDPGFGTGETFLYDEDGVVTLEHLNGWRILHGGRVARERDVGDQNFPYFRFALGGRMEKADDAVSPLL